jgi:5-methyltetrahydrofolate--homocysteine methyltransferase
MGIVLFPLHELSKGGNPMSENQLLEHIRSAIMSLSIPGTRDAVQRALDAGVDPLDIVKGGLSEGLTAVGNKWLNKEMFISHVLVAAKAMAAGQELVEQKLVGREGDYVATVVIGTPKGDLHDIGKNLVAMMMKAGGFKVYDLGVDVEPQAFIDKANEVNADLIAMSLIMSICLDKMEEACRLAKAQGVRAKTLIGGPPTSAKVAQTIGADAYGGFDAPTAVQTAKKLLGLS